MLKLIDIKKIGNITYKLRQSTPSMSYSILAYFGDKDTIGRVQSKTSLIWGEFGFTRNSRGHYDRLNRKV